jgi:hypothetical protein
VGDLLGPLVDEEQNEVGLGVVLGDGLSQVLEQRRLARLGGRDDEAALAPADRRDEVDHPQAGLGLLPREGERLGGVDGDQVLEVGKGLVLFGRKAPCLRHLDQRATPATTTVAGQPLDLRAVAQPVVPGDRSRNNDVVAGRQVVLGRLPYVSPGAFGKLDHARDRRRGAGRRDRRLSGIPRPFRTLVLQLGSVGPVVSVVVTMAPRVSRAVPHGRPVRRESVIVSSGP